MADVQDRRTLSNRDPLFAALAEHPLAMQWVRATLGWPALLSNISANITGPGALTGVLHADHIGLIVRRLLRTRASRWCRSRPRPAAWSRLRAVSGIAPVPTAQPACTVLSVCNLKLRPRGSAARLGAALSGANRFRQGRSRRLRSWTDIGFENEFGLDPCLDP